MEKEFAAEFEKRGIPQPRFRFKEIPIGYRTVRMQAVLEWPVGPELPDECYLYLEYRTDDEEDYLCKLYACNPFGTAPQTGHLLATFSKIRKNLLAFMDTVELFFPETQHPEKFCELLRAELGSDPIPKLDLTRTAYSNQMKYFIKILIIDESTKSIRYKYDYGQKAAGRILLESVDASWRPKGPGWHLELMSITPQRSGYGTVLLAKALSDLRGRGISHLTVHPTTPEAVAFFWKNGFIPIGSNGLMEIEL